MNHGSWKYKQMLAGGVDRDMLRSKRANQDARGVGQQAGAAEVDADAGDGSRVGDCARTG